MRDNASRRNRLAVAGSGLAVLAVAGVVFAPGLASSSARPSVAAVVPAASDPATIPVPPVPPVPTWQQAQAHGPQIASILMAAVPAGYHGQPQYSFPDGPTATWLRQPPAAWYGSMTSIIVSAGGREGLLQAYLIRDEGLVPEGELCSASVAARFDPMFGVQGRCQVYTVDNVPIRVITGHHPQLGGVILAVRMLGGGYLAVQASQGQWTFDTDGDLPPDAKAKPTNAPQTAPPLSTLVFTPDQLAALAANRGMLP